MSESNADVVRSVYAAWARGDHVVAIVRYRARGKQSGLEVEGRESALFTLRDGKVVRYEWFHGPTDAEDAVAARGRRTAAT